MVGKFAKITAGVLALLAVLALAWTFAISKAQLEIATLALTLLFTVVIPLLTVFMIVKKDRGFRFAVVMGIFYALLGAATVFRTLGATDPFLQTTMYIGIASVVLGLLLVFSGIKARMEYLEENGEESNHPSPFEELKRQKEAARESQ